MYSGVLLNRFAAEMQGGGGVTHMRGTNAAGKQIDEGGHIREGDMNNYEGRFFITDFPQNVLLTGSCTVKP